MGSLLLAVIYLIFISLGLPDSLLGSGWPKMQAVFGVPSSYAGYVSMTISFMTIISALLSAKRGEVSDAVRRILQEKETLKEENTACKTELVRLKAQQVPETEGNICLFETIADEIAMREFTNLLMEKCDGMAAVFFPAADTGFRYIIGSRSADLRRAARDINAGISGRGGGRPEMIQGTALADEETIRSFILRFRVSG